MKHLMHLCLKEMIYISQALLHAALGAYMSGTDSSNGEPEVINLVDDESDDGRYKKQKKRGRSR